MIPPSLCCLVKCSHPSSAEVVATFLLLRSPDGPRWPGVSSLGNISCHTFTSSPPRHSTAPPQVWTLPTPGNSGPVPVLTQNFASRLSTQEFLGNQFILKPCTWYQSLWIQVSENLNFCCHLDQSLISGESRSCPCLELLLSRKWLLSFLFRNKNVFVTSFVSDTCQFPYEMLLQGLL